MLQKAPSTFHIIPNINDAFYTYFNFPTAFSIIGMQLSFSFYPYKKTESISCQRYVSVFFVYEDSTLLRAVYFYMRRMYTASAYSCSNSVTCNSNCRFIIYYINYIYKPPWGFIFKKFYLIKLSIPFFNFPSPSLS